MPSHWVKWRGDRSRWAQIGERTLQRRCRIVTPTLGSRGAPLLAIVVDGHEDHTNANHIARTGIVELEKSRRCRKQTALAAKREILASLVSGSGLRPDSRNNGVTGRPRQRPGTMEKKSLASPACTNP